MVSMTVMLVQKVGASLWRLLSSSTVSLTVQIGLRPIVSRSENVSIRCSVISDSMKGMTA